jgi:hypothetical protein
MIRCRAWRSPSARSAPLAQAGLIYARLLVAHLAAPAKAVGQWLTQIAPGGRLALDEVEWIRTDESVLKEYLGIATALIAQHGGDMYAGPRLAALPFEGAAAVRLSDVTVLRSATEPDRTHGRRPCTSAGRAMLSAARPQASGGRPRQRADESIQPARWMRPTRGTACGDPRPPFGQSQVGVDGLAIR